jgi:hypothetical protein
MIMQGNLGSLSAEQVEQLVSMTHVAKTCTKVGSHTHPFCVPILLHTCIHRTPSLPAPMHLLMGIVWNVGTLAAQIIYFLVANHVECLEGEVVTGFFNDHHACLPPLLHGHRALVQQHTAQMHTGQTPHMQVPPGVVSSHDARHCIDQALTPAFPMLLPNSVPMQVEAPLCRCCTGWPSC